SYAAQGAAMLAIYATAALVAALGGGFAAASACSDGPNRRRLGWRTFAGLLASGVVATLVTVSYAKTTDYSTNASVVFREVGLVVVICLAGLTAVAISFRPPRAGGVRGRQ